MKKNKQINAKLMLETLREIMPVSLLFIGIMIIFTCINIFEFAGNAQMSMNAYENVRIFIPLPFVNYSSMIFSVVGSAVLTVFAFKFLSRRSSSDLYFSFPESRLSLFNSRFFAVIICMAFGFVINGVTALVMYSIFSEEFMISISGIFLGLVSLMLISFVTVCAFSMAASLTGKVSGSVILGAMILLTPGYVTTCINGYLSDSLILAKADISSLWGGAKGLVFETLKSIFGGEESYMHLSNYDSVEFLSSASNIVLTAMIGIAAYALAVLAFERRNVEIAGNVKYSKKKQMLFGIWITFLISFVACPSLLSQITGTSVTTESWTFYVLVFMLSVLAYFLYILSTRKNLKSAGKMIYGFLLAFVIDTVLLSGAYVYVQNENNFLQDTNEIKGIHFSAFDSTYASKELEDYYVTDEDAVNLIERSYKKAYDARMRDSNDYYELTVIFKTEKGNKERYVYVSKDDAVKLADILCKDKKVSDAMSRIPTLDEIKKSKINFMSAGAISKSSTENIQSFNGDISAEKLYEYFYEDVMEHGMGKNEIKKIFGISYDEEMLSYLIMSSYNGDDTFEFCISENDTRALKYINECFVKKRRNEVDGIIDILSNYDKRYKISVDIALDNYDVGGAYSDLQDEQIKGIDPQKLKDELCEKLTMIPDSREINCMTINVSKEGEWIYNYSFSAFTENDIPDELKFVLDNYA